MERNDINHRNKKMQFGFIGLGNMGGGLARNLVRAGKEVLLFDLSSEGFGAEDCNAVYKVIK